MAECVHAGYSAVSTTSPTNSLSQTMMGMFSTTPAELSPAGKKSWRSFKFSFVRSPQRSDSVIDYMQYGSSVARVCDCSLTMCFQVLHTNGQPTAIARSEAFQ